VKFALKQNAIVKTIQSETQLACPNSFEPIIPINSLFFVSDSSHYISINLNEFALEIAQQLFNIIKFWLLSR